MPGTSTLEELGTLEEEETELDEGEDDPVDEPTDEDADDEDEEPLGCGHAWVTINREVRQGQCTEDGCRFWSESDEDCSLVIAAQEQAMLAEEQRKFIVLQQALLIKQAEKDGIDLSQQEGDDEQPEESDNG